MVDNTSAMGNDSRPGVVPRAPVNKMAVSYHEGEINLYHQFWIILGTI